MIKRLLSVVLTATFLVLGLGAITSPAQAAYECTELHAPGDQEFCIGAATLYANGDVRIRAFFRGENLGWIADGNQASYGGDFDVVTKHGSVDILGSVIPKGGEYRTVCCAQPSGVSYSLTVRLDNYVDDYVSGYAPWGCANGCG